MVVECVILALTNESLGQISEKNISQMQVCITEYLSVVVDNEQVSSYPVEFFNSLELSGVPSDKLRIRVGVSVLLIRNLDVPSLHNGTRLQITHLGPNFVRATVMIGMARGESVLIPRIPIIPKDLPSQFKR
ncbi:hypothetical protein AVEN_63419-1 [Araneus ventricosus]|uniref:DNA helicase Pif1-like 2B domain-containing protein n=1 Tax=Araneus ventricosus TaxID=182803 RepID=A0A4Y2R5N3_ARAVE|nr:hypothetical protein AVEN_63419-1 [Araneus ventricosus]